MCFAQQVEIVMALYFCLALRPPVLEVTPELLMVLQEALRIAEAAEQVTSLVCRGFWVLAAIVEDEPTYE